MAKKNPTGRAALRARLKELDQIESEMLAKYDEAALAGDLEAQIDFGCVIARARSARAMVMRAIDGRNPLPQGEPPLISNAIH